jgi:hypothetical protein
MNESYNREIEPIIKELASIFDPLCSELCSGCTVSCCEPCAREKGYYKAERFEELKRKYSFDEKKGFLGPNGCLIPRLLRSTRCLYHICLRIQFKIIKEKGPDGFTKFKEKIEKLSAQHNKIISEYGVKNQ